MRAIDKGIAFVLAVASIGCSKSEQKSAAADSGMPAPMTRNISIGDVAGTWSVKSYREGSDSVLTTYDLVATNDTTPWTMNFANGPKVPLKILSVAGDSIVAQSATYESVLRKGVKVQIDAVMRLKDGKLVSSFVAHYTVPSADSVLKGHAEGMRKS